jgi:galactitol-specific phosphotransferase system IIC component
MIIMIEKIYRGRIVLPARASDETHKEIVKQHYGLHKLALTFCFILGLIGGIVGMYSLTASKLEVEYERLKVAGKAGGVIFALSLILCWLIVATCHVDPEFGKKKETGKGVQDPSTTDTQGKGK